MRIARWHGPLTSPALLQSALLSRVSSSGRRFHHRIEGSNEPIRYSHVNQPDADVVPDTARFLSRRAQEKTSNDREIISLLTRIHMQLFAGLMSKRSRSIYEGFQSTLTIVYNNCLQLDCPAGNLCSSTSRIYISWLCLRDSLLHCL